MSKKTTQKTSARGKTARKRKTPAQAKRRATAKQPIDDAARQAAQDGYHGPAVVLGLEVGEEPEDGVEFEIELAHEVGADCPMMGCVEDGSAYEPDAAPLTAAAYEAQRASEPDCRDEDDARTLALLAEATGADLSNAQLLDIADAVERGEVELPVGDGCSDG